MENKEDLNKKSEAQRNELLRKPDKNKLKYPESGGGEMILKEMTYPESGGGEMISTNELETHLVKLKQLRTVPDKKISSPQDVQKIVKDMENYDREYFVVIWLNTKNYILGIENVSRGSIDQAVVHPRETAKGALLSNASGVILLHNHPSGDPSPSNEDEKIMSQLSNVFDLIGIKVIDALIIGRDKYYSFREHDDIKKLKGDNMTSVKEDNDACSIAMKAAMSTIQDYCGRSQNAPKTYSKWTFADYERIIPDIVDIDQLEELENNVDLSKSMTDKDKTTIKNKIKQMIEERKRFYATY